MLYRQYTENKTISGALAWSTSKQTVTLRIPQSRRRLEGIMLEAQFSTGTGTQTATIDCYMNLFSEIRLRVNDVLGSRNLIQCPGSQLIQFNRDQGNAIDRHTLAGYKAPTGGKNYRIFVPIWIRHPAVAEPVGNLLALPLDQLNEDPILELDIAPQTDCSTFTTTQGAIVMIRTTLIYREIDPGVKYMPTELVTSKWTLPGSGRQSFELSNGGFLSSVTLDNYTTFPTTRAALWASFDHELQVDSGSTALRRYFPDILDSMNDIVTGNQMFGGSGAAWASPSALVDITGATATIGGSSIGHSFIDFLFDDSFGGAVSPGSMLNCNTIPLGGDKIKITGTNFSAAGTIAVTTHKFLTRSTEELKALIGA